MEAIKNIWKDRYTLAQPIAAVATVLNLLGLLLIFKMTDISSAWTLVGGLLLIFGLVLTCCAYILGGLWTAIKAAFSIGTWGFIVVPFPYAIATGPIVFILALVAFFLIPIFPVRKALQEHQIQQYVAQQIQ